MVDDGVDDLVAELERRVAQRQASGAMPADLDDALDAQWRAFSPPPDALGADRLDALTQSIAAARASAAQGRRKFDPDTLVDALDQMQQVVVALRDEVLRGRRD